MLAHCLPSSERVPSSEYIYLHTLISLMYIKINTYMLMFICMYTCIKHIASNLDTWILASSEVETQIQ